MPSSFVDSVPPIVKQIVDFDPKRILDVGPGWGKYGLMCREYLPALEMLWALEVLEGMLPTQSAIYDRVLFGDVRNYCSVSYKPPFSLFDLILLIDVIEHLSLKDGHVVLDGFQRAGCHILVSTPKVFVEQHDPKNPYEDHLSLWAWGDFEQHGVLRDSSTPDSIIYLIGPSR